MEITTQEIINEFGVYDIIPQEYEVKIIHKFINAPKLPKSKKMELLSKYMDDLFLSLMSWEMQKNDKA